MFLSDLAQQTDSLLKKALGEALAPISASLELVKLSLDSHEERIHDMEEGLNSHSDRIEAIETTCTALLAENERLKSAVMDSAVMEEEMVYVRSASEGKVKVDFVRVKAVSKPDATNIAEAICSIMESGVSTDWKDKLVAITTDGASVMTGVNNGVVRNLRVDRPNVLGIHCMAHKLELAFSD